MYICEVERLKGRLNTNLKKENVAKNTVYTNRNNGKSNVYMYLTSIKDLNTNSRKGLNTIRQKESEAGNDYKDFETNY